MDIRKVQKTGDMHYVYLPTSWCKKNKINSKTKVFLDENNGVLSISPTEIKRTESKISLSVEEDNQDIINKLIVACYLNPLKSFKIKFSKEMDATKLLQLKNIVSLESVEIEKNIISSDSNIVLSDPDMLFKTLIRKIKNLLILMENSYNSELMKRYEEEVDRSKTLIEKAVILHMSNGPSSKLKIIDLYYISVITRDLERMVDHLILIDEEDLDFISDISNIISKLKEIIEPVNFQKECYFSYKISIDFLKKIKEIKDFSPKDKKYYDKRRIKGLLLKVSEVILNWSITNEINK
jgi:phosphate uptake regulator